MRFETAVILTCGKGFVREAKGRIYCSAGCHHKAQEIEAWMHVRLLSGLDAIFPRGDLDGGHAGYH